MNISKLEINRLIKELEFIESELEYRSSLINDADDRFLLEVDTILSDYPELKELYDKKIDDTLKKSFIRKEEVISVEEAHQSLQSPKVKKIYRKIVKITHPDISAITLSNFYLRASEYYKNNDIIGLYKICQILDIDFTIDEDDNLLLLNKINEMKVRIEFIENTLTWKWMNTDNVGEKCGMMFNFIKASIK